MTPQPPASSLDSTHPPSGRPLAPRQTRKAYKEGSGMGAASEERHEVLGGAVLETRADVDDDECAWPKATKEAQGAGDGIGACYAV